MASTDDSVTVLETQVITCAGQHQDSDFDFSSTFHLGPLDYLVSPVVPITEIFIYEHKDSSKPEPVNLDRLRRALPLLLDYYPHLTGRLNILPDGSFNITRLGTGAELLSAKCSSPLEAFSVKSAGPAGGPRRISLLDLPGSGGNALFAPWEGTPEGACRDPLFTVQHTRFACGGVALGVKVHHAACDAEGFFQLSRNLAELYRGLQDEDAPVLAQKPYIRSIMSEPDRMTTEEKQEALEFKPKLLHLGPPSSASSENGITEPVGGTDVSAAIAEESPPPTIGRLLRFSSKALAALKADATDADGDGWISTYSALAGLFYQRIYQARRQHFSANPSAMSAPDFLFPFNVRGPSRLNLPPNYFPASLFCICSSLPTSTLSDAPLPNIAQHIQNLTRDPQLTNSSSLTQTMRWISAQPDKRRIETSNFTYGSGSLMISQWAKFDMYEGMRFEDCPVLAQTPFTPISLMDGLLYFLPTEALGSEVGGDKGALDANVALIEPVWEILDADKVFMRYLEM